MSPDWIGCSPHNYRPGRPLGFRPELIVIHVIVGSLLSADRWFNNPASSVSAHYGVGRDGRIHQYVAETDTAFHAGIVVNSTSALVKDRPRVNPNYYSIGIEHEGQPKDAWTPQQAAASVALIVEIAQRWKIPIDGEHIIQHHLIRACKTCPGSQQKVDLLIAGARAAAGLALPAAPEQPAPQPPPVRTIVVPPAPEAPAPPATPPTSVTPATPVTPAEPVVPVAPASPAEPPSPTQPPAQPVVVAHPEIHAVINVRVRKGEPSTNSPVVNVLQAHAPINPVDAVIGESIQGNPMWYRDADGNFIWAGGTDAPHPKA